MTAWASKLEIKKKEFCVWAHNRQGDTTTWKTPL